MRLAIRYEEKVNGTTGPGTNSFPTNEKYLGVSEHTDCYLFSLNFGTIRVKYGPDRDRTEDITRRGGCLDVREHHR